VRHAGDDGAAEHGDLGRALSALVGRYRIGARQNSEAHCRRRSRWHRNCWAA